MNEKVTLKDNEVPHIQWKEVDIVLTLDFFHGKKAFGHLGAHDPNQKLLSMFLYSSGSKNKCVYFSVYSN